MLKMVAIGKGAWRGGMGEVVTSRTFYGRQLSVSGRPCYILPMFFYIFFMAALFSGPG